jgi:hypothetical protein
MGEGTTRVVEADGAGARVRELGDEITQVRRWLNALVAELDRRRHNATNWRLLLRNHAGTVAVGALVLAAVVATPLAISQTRRRQRSPLLRHGAELTEKARRLGQALGRVATDPDRLAAAPPPRVFGLVTSALVGIALTAAQILARAVLERRARPDEAAPPS